MFILFTRTSLQRNNKKKIHGMEKKEKIGLVMQIIYLWYRISLIDMY